MAAPLGCQRSYHPLRAIPSRTLTASHVNLIAIAGGLYSNVASDSLAHAPAE
jgi:hypothetical protein